MAARQAAKKGEVLIIDAMSLPREKSCGGMLNEYSQAYLETIAALPDSIISEPEWINFRFFDWDRNIRKATKLRFANVNRMKFDEWLCSFLPSNVEIAASTRLVRLSQDNKGVTVTVKPSNDLRASETEIRCDYLIGCDGPRSTCRRQLPVSQLSLYKTLQEIVKTNGELEPYFDCIYSRNIGSNYGYGYVIPKDDYAIIGSVFFPKSKGCKELHEKALNEFSSYYPYGSEVLQREAWVAVQVTSVNDIVGGHGRVLLAGEAGGIMSPSSGEGISFAMNSGNLAGMAVAQASGKQRLYDLPKVIEIGATNETVNFPDESEALKIYRQSLGPIKRNIARRLRYFPVLNSNWGKWLGGSSPNFLVDAVAHRI